MGNGQCSDVNNKSYPRYVYKAFENLFTSNIVFNETQKSPCEQLCNQFTWCIGFAKFNTNKIQLEFMFCELYW